jgi:creatinine amidohydrolase/Fe(II)-dependent formamide hydrolase-like protein
MPLGSLEQHGPHLPLGTDLLCAQALANFVAEQVDGVLLPALPFTWAGGTRTYPVAMNLRNGPVIDMLKSLFDAVRRAGFKRLALVNWHGGSGASIRVAVREYFTATRWPVVVLKPRGGSEARESLAPLLRGNESEASCTLGSLIVLGHADLVEPFMRRVREAAQQYESVEITEDFPALDLIRSYGMIGHDYAHECRHVAPTIKTDPQAGMEYLTAYARHLVSAVKALEQFQEELEGGALP